VVVVAVIEAEFHLFEVKKEVLSGDAIVMAQLVFGEARKVLNCIDMATLSVNDYSNLTVTTP
jgi:hypothetical protein